MSRAPVPTNPPSPTGSQAATAATAFAQQALARPELSLQIMSNPLYLSGTREMVAGVARRLGYTEEVCSQLALAVDEALCNVIRHGYGRASDRPIWISVYPIPEPGAVGPWGDACLPESLRIVIEDEARQVDPAIIKSRDLEEIRPGGLGVHIIQTVMDSAVYERRAGAGMRLTMVKKRSSESKKLDRAGEAGSGCCDCAAADGAGSRPTTSNKERACGQ